MSLACTSIPRTHAIIGAARSAFFPHISLTGNAGFASIQLPSLFENTAWTFTGQLSELLDRGGVASRLDRLDRLQAVPSSLAARQAVVQLPLAWLQIAVLQYRVLGGGAGPATPLRPLSVRVCP